MLKKAAQVLSKQDLTKKINWQLQQNFFSLEEVQSLSLRKLQRILKLIAQTREVKLKRKELKEIARFLKSNFTEAKISAQKLWTFIRDYFIELKTKIIKVIVVEDQLWPCSYQADRYEIMRN